MTAPGPCSLTLSTIKHPRSTPPSQQPPIIMHNACLKQMFIHLAHNIFARISILPFLSLINRSEVAQQRVRSVRPSLFQYSLRRATSSATSAFSLRRGVLAGCTPYNRSPMHATTSDKPLTAPLAALNKDGFGQVSRAFEDGVTGAETLTPVLRWLTTNVDYVHPGVGTLRYSILPCLTGHPLEALIGNLCGSFIRERR